MGDVSLVSLISSRELQISSPFSGESIHCRDDGILGIAKLALRIPRFRLGPESLMYLFERKRHVFYYEGPFGEHESGGGLCPPLLRWFLILTSHSTLGKDQPGPSHA